MELYIEPIRLQRNAVNGKFLKGHTPFNYGKKWSDYLHEDVQNKLRKNLKIGRFLGNPNLPGWNKKAVVAIKEGKFCGVFESCVDAGTKLHVQIRNVSHVANGKRKRCGGYEFYFESDFDKWCERITE